MTEQERQDARKRAERQVLFIEEAEFLKRLHETRDWVLHEYAVARSDRDRMICESDEETFKAMCNNVHFGVREILWTLEKLAAELSAQCANIRNDLGERPFDDED